MKRHFFVFLIMAAILIVVLFSTILFAQEQEANAPTDTTTAEQTQAAKELRWYRDADGDGYGCSDKNDGKCSILSVTKPKGYTRDCRDCDDTDPNVHPGAPEICGDGIDQDCEGSDLSCPLTLDGT